MKYFVQVGLMVVAMLVAGCEGEETAKVTPAAPAPATQPAKQPLVQVRQVADWCPEHGVPESICTRCNESLTAGFKEKGDWCATHDLPESQCFVCHPELKAKFEAMKPKGS